MTAPPRITVHRSSGAVLPPWMRVIRTALPALFLGLGLVPPGTAAQEIPREEYLRQLPLSNPRLSPATEASTRLALFGDPGASDYRDVDPIDGIDDRRHRVLMDLAVRFAPYLVQNTTNVPLNFDVFIENRDVFPLFIDTWDVAGQEVELLEMRGVNLSALGDVGCNPRYLGAALDRYPEPTDDPAIEDCKLLELMNRYTPGTGVATRRDDQLVRGAPSLFDVLFLNFPGEGESTWEEAYEPEWERTPEERRASFVHSYVHPFLRDLDGGYELILQYWFFYPTNDSGMDHEGDWEHMNVIVSPLSMVEAPLSAETVTEILDGTRPVNGEVDPLVIRRVDYYFHEFVWPLDFSRPNVYLPHDAWKAQGESIHRERFREDDTWRKLRYMAWADDAETVINTHPLGYIGADNKGLNQALEPPGGSNQEPHGTYPFPGRYNNVGPGGTTDQVARHVDIREHLGKVADGTAEEGPTFEDREVIGLADPNRLRIVPDWERVVDLARTDPGARRDWAWLLLPVHWGYPATRSPFAGTLEHFNTGNVAPPGPSFNAGWNVSGPSSGFDLYEPHSLPAVFPLQVQDGFRNDLGFLNLTVPLLLNLPPLDFVARLVAYPLEAVLGRHDPVYYPRDGLPYRFVGLSTGVTASGLDEGFATLAVNARQRDEFLESFFQHFADNPFTPETEVTGGGEYYDDYMGPFVDISFYVGRRFVTENTVRNIRSSFGLRVDFTNIPSYVYDADLNYWEYSGGIRYNILTEAILPYVKGGYGWSWYRLQNVRIGDVPMSQPNSRWFTPTVWPTVWHYGLGVEFVPWRRPGVEGGGFEMALRLEYARYQQTLRMNFDDVRLEDLAIIFPTIGDVPTRTRVHRNDFLLGISLTF